MPDPDILNEAATPPPPPSRRGNQRFRRLRNLSDRTSLRTKLITALLGLVIIAIAAISVASVVMLRSYVETRQDSDLKAAAGYYFNRRRSPTVAPTFRRFSGLAAVRRFVPVPRTRRTPT